VETVGKRYQLQNELDRGGMGVVYRAQDRLSGQVIALKRVSVGGVPGSSGDSTDFRLALAQEFKTLATLRHPNIISVLDYGFDGERQPYFTMELLEHGQTVLAAGRGRTAEGKFDLIVQILQALSYLHRRGVIHRDLKPANILVVAGQVKVLDFGLAVARDYISDHADDSFSGTLSYTAPEVLRGQPVSEQSDLYALGVIAYELFAGRHPFAGSPKLLQDILYTDPDLRVMELESSLEAIIARLLSKDAEDRYESAQDVIEAYAQSSQKALEVESASIRESFLQAARFVGRQAEMSRLSAALTELLTGTGSAWLVGGESGVGKSRLLDELRTLALVKGMRVLRGQAVSEGGQPYQAWRDVLRELCLQTDLTPFEASILKMLVPDLDTLLNHPVADPPGVESEAIRERLVQVIAGLLARQKEPLVIILEDIHWATGESVTLLKRFSANIKEMPVMLVATYRDDEQPELRNQLQTMELIRLSRLSRETIGELSASMLGEQVGRQEEVVNLLARETEGNIFFIVEVVRALAEEAGQLAQVGQLALPEKVFSGGMQAVLERRLSYVPEKARPLLRAAAVSGRQLDLEMLKLIDRDGTGESRGGTSPFQTPLDSWLSTCADVAILEVQGERWRFAHDKLREGLLANLDPSERLAVHRQVAQAMEKLYSDSPEHAASLAYHWQILGDAPKEAHYAGIAGEQAYRIGAHRKAISFLERALESGKDMDSFRRARWERQLGEAHYAMGELPESLVHLRRTAVLLGYSAPSSVPRQGISILGNAIRQLIHRSAPKYFLGRATRDIPQRLEAVRAFERMAQIAVLFNNIPLDLTMALKMLNLAESLPPSAELARAYAVMGGTLGIAGFYSAADGYMRYADRTAQQVNDQSAMAWVEEIGGFYLTGVGRWEEARARFQRGAAIAQELGDWRRWLENFTLELQLMMDIGQFQEAKMKNFEALERTARQEDHQIEIYTYVRQTFIAATEGYLDAAAEYGRCAQAVELQLSPGESIGRYSLPALVHARQREYADAWVDAEMGRKLAQGVTPTLPFSLNWYTALPQTYLMLWEEQAPVASEQDIRAAARATCKILNRWARSFPVGRPASNCNQGLFYWLDGQPDKARAAWGKSLAYAQKLAMPLDEGIAHYEIGRHMDVSDPKRAEHLERAVEIFEQRDARYYTWKAQEALDTKIRT
jgi:eukaryotic-like serine/threonine-protein kinase